MPAGGFEHFVVHMLCAEFHGIKEDSANATGPDEFELMLPVRLGAVPPHIPLPAPT